MTPPRALIVFAKLPRPGEVKTRLGKDIGMEEACRVYERFSRHAFTIAAALQDDQVSVHLRYAAGAEESAVRAWVGHGFRYAVQEGASLGDRMSSAFRDAFADGAREVIIIGTDVPELNADRVRTAFDKLRSCDVVIGPSSDGGYYLLGMKDRPSDVFAGISWSTGSVLRETRLLLDRLNLTTGMLPALSDIDTIEDYHAYLRRVRRPDV